MKRVGGGLIVVMLAASACGSGVRSIQPPSPPPPVSVPTTVSPRATVSSPPTAEPRPRFAATIGVLDAKTRATMRYSWRPGCPVAIEDLRIVSLSFWGFDGTVHRGELIVNRSVADDVVKVFGVLFGSGFPIERMVPIDVYHGDDERSMEADNTSAFNCRPVTGGTAFSEHSYGRAIDVNPLRNPYITSTGQVLPPAGARYANRSLHLRGMIHAGGVVVRAFASVDWGWGGSWTSIKDYQHFSTTGR